MEIHFQNEILYSQICYSSILILRTSNLSFHVFLILCIWEKLSRRDFYFSLNTMFRSSSLLLIFLNWNDFSLLKPHFLIDILKINKCYDPFAKRGQNGFLETDLSASHCNLFLTWLLVEWKSPEHMIIFEVLEHIFFLVSFPLHYHPQ